MPNKSMHGVHLDRKVFGGAANQSSWTESCTQRPCPSAHIVCLNGVQTGAEEPACHSLGPAVQRPPEKWREGNHVVDLVGEVAAARSNDHIRPCGDGCGRHSSSRQAGRHTYRQW
jgi:hypothetical protein